MAAQQPAPADGAADGAAGLEEQGDALLSLVMRTCTKVLGVELSPSSCFVHAGGDSLSALAVSKRLLEAQGGAWPDDGIVLGTLSPLHLMGCVNLREYAVLLQRKGYGMVPGVGMEGLSSGGEGDDEASRARRGSHAWSEDGDSSGKASEERVEVDEVLCLELRERVCQGACESVRELVRKGTDLNAGLGVCGGEGVPPLHLAASLGLASMCGVLLEGGARANGKMCFYKRTPAHCAAAWGRADALGVLIGGGAAVRARDKARLTVLHDAARGGCVECLKLVMQAGGGADMKARDKWGRSPLHWAVLNGQSEAARLLISLGADTSPPPMPRRVQRRRTTLVQPATLVSLAAQVLPPEHDMHAILRAAEGEGHAGSAPSAQRRD